MKTPAAESNSMLPTKRKIRLLLGVYWLFDALGARDLEWRTGGSGEGVADGGRDLEVTFYVPSPDGEMEEERWWVECKGRSGSLEANAVKSAVNNATAQGDLACLVIVTNTTFSNPTRDWVKAWRDGKTLPRGVVEVLLMPILGQLADEMGDVYSADCYRFFGSERRTFLRQEDPLDSYWQRLEQNGAPTDDGPHSYVRVEKTIEPCKVGFEVDDKRLCPLFQMDPTVENVSEFLAIIERVSEFRLRQAHASRAQSSPRK